MLLKINSLRVSLVSFSLLLISQDLLGHGDLHQRMTVLTKAISQTPNDSLFLKRAQLLRDVGNLESAMKDFKRVLEITPQNSTALYWGAKTALEMNHLKDAQSLAARFFSGIQNLPNNASYARAYQLFADICLAKDHIEESIVYSKKSLNLQSHPIPDHWLKLAKLQLQQGKYNEALATLEQALLQSGDNAIIQQRIVEISVHNKDFTTALLYLDKQLNNSASLRKVILLIEKSEVLLLNDHSEEAINTKGKALQAFDKLPDTIKNKPIALSVKQRLLTTSKGHLY